MAANGGILGGLIQQLRILMAFVRRTRAFNIQFLVLGLMAQLHLCSEPFKINVFILIIIPMCTLIHVVSTEFE